MLFSVHKEELELFHPLMLQRVFALNIWARLEVTTSLGTYQVSQMED